MAKRSGNKSKANGRNLPRRAVHLKPGKYADGAPFDQVQRLECKIILKPEPFTSQEVFWDFARVVQGVARKSDVGFSTKGFKDSKPQIREVIFLDTADSRIYKHSFILRRRIPYENGFPASEPEIVFKARLPDAQAAAEIDVRPRISGEYRVKFKVEVLPLKGKSGSLRELFSHNVQFPLSSMHEGDPRSFETLARVFPPLRKVLRSKGEKVVLVSHTIIEEVLQDIGLLDFGKGITAMANVTLWRRCGDHLPIVGEFSYEIKFKPGAELDGKAMARCEQFFVVLQEAAEEWILFGSTKTGIVYGLGSNPVPAHE
jgi:hypothetical protein